jgi:hypothetical protein
MVIIRPVPLLRLAELVGRAGGFKDMVECRKLAKALVLPSSGSVVTDH